MRLWGRVFAGSLLVFAAVFAGVAVAIPEARAAALGAAAICVGFALLVVPWIVRFFLWLTGDARLLATGREARATVRELAPTLWRYNRTDPVLRFYLEVEDAGSVYRAVTQQSVPAQLVPRLGPGVVVRVRVDPADPRRLVLDWRQPIQPAS